MNRAIKFPKQRKTEGFHEADGCGHDSVQTDRWLVTFGRTAAECPSILNIKTTGSSKASVEIHHNARRHILEDTNFLRLRFSDQNSCAITISYMHGTCSANLSVYKKWQSENEHHSYAVAVPAPYAGSLGPVGWLQCLCSSVSPRKDWDGSSLGKLMSTKYLRMASPNLEWSCGRPVPCLPWRLLLIITLKAKAFLRGSSNALAQVRVPRAVESVGWATLTLQFVRQTFKMKLHTVFLTHMQAYKWRFNC
jgi:hypothetical protein